MTAITRAMPWIDRVVAPDDRVDRVSPTPVRSKIVSVRTAPDRSVPSDRPITVTTGSKRVAEGMPEDDDPFGEALGTGGPHVVEAEHVEQAANGSCGR